MLTKFKPLIGFLYLFVGMVFSQPSMKDGERFLETGEMESAKTVFLQHTKNPQAVEFLGDISSFNKDWDEAISYYRKLVKLEPDNGMYNFKLGGALGMKAYYGTKLEAALLIGEVKKYLKKAAELDPTHKEARRALVEFYMQLPGFLGGSQTIAESYASDLDRLNEIDALLADAYIYRHKNYRELARNKYEEALMLTARKPELLVRNYQKYELGEASALFEIQPEIGERLLKEYIKDYGYRDLKSPAWAYLRLAQIERERKNRESALEFIEKSLAIDSGFEKAKEEKYKIQSL